jgi:hypothetical protein
MNRCWRAGIIGLLIVAGVALEARAQGGHDSTTVFELVLRDGSRMYGTVEKDTADGIVLRTTAGVVVTARRDQMLTLKPVTGRVIAGEFQRSDPNTTRLFFAPTGRALKRGQAYLGVHELLLPSFQVGVTDRISVGGGTPLVFFGEGDLERPFWVTPKVQVLDTGRFQAAAGVFHGFDMDGDGGGIAYGVATAGSPIGSLTAGAGMAYANDGGRSFVVMIGGDRQIARSVKLITENYVWKGGDGLLSVGFRFFGEQLSADLGLMVPMGADEMFVFPMVNFVYLF